MSWILNYVLARPYLIGMVAAIVFGIVSQAEKYEAQRLQAKAELELSHYRQQVADASAAAQAQARNEEQEMRVQNERIARENFSKQQDLARRVTLANAAAAGLRDEIARLNSRPTPDDPRAAAFADEARTARELLGSCADEYRTVASKADQLRDQVNGLQDFLKSVVPPKH